MKAKRVNFVGPTYLLLVAGLIVGWLYYYLWTTDWTSNYTSTHIRMQILAIIAAISIGFLPYLLNKDYKWDFALMYVGSINSAWFLFNSGYLLYNYDKSETALQIQVYLLGILLSIPFYYAYKKALKSGNSLWKIINLLSVVLLVLFILVFSLLSYAFRNGIPLQD